MYMYLVPSDTDSRASPDDVFPIVHTNPSATSSSLALPPMRKRNSSERHRVHYPSIPEEEEVVSSVAVSFSLPQHSRGLGIQANYHKEENEHVLVFHGTILRSQLVTLLEHKIFFREEDGVRGRVMSVTSDERVVRVTRGVCE